MARKLRFESQGGLYHVLNRGNFRSWIFESEGAKRSFETALQQTCARSGWILHAWVVMGNHFHLAVETPQPNLSEGMRWLQSVFAVRFNQFRHESGHIFQGRFKSIVVENPERLAWLCHYIHLNPVRAGICDVSRLSDYGFGSYRWLWSKAKDRPEHLEVRMFLEGAGNLRDTPKGHRDYANYLAWLVEDEPARKEMQFEKMSKGWALGSDAFRRELIKDEQELLAQIELGVSDARELREAAWECTVRTCMNALGETESGVTSAKKAADWKVAIAAKLKTEQLCRNGWISKRLNMGADAAISRYCAEMFHGERPQAMRLFQHICSNSKD